MGGDLYRPRGFEESAEWIEQIVEQGHRVAEVEVLGWFVEQHDGGGADQHSGE